tara:strand:- start:13 stop:213 length:201 start_codon:yes stop_codon:yes gene_type:complete
MYSNSNGLIKVSRNNLYSIVSNYTYVDEYLLYDDTELAKYFKSLISKGTDQNTIIDKLIEWVNNNY